MNYFDFHFSCEQGSRVNQKPCISTLKTFTLLCLTHEISQENEKAYRL